MSVITQGWKRLRISEVTKVVTGTTPPKANQSNYGSYIPFIKPPQLQDSTILQWEEMLSETGASNGRTAPSGSILVTCIGILGRAGLAKQTVAFNQQINAILPNAELDSKFMFYQAQSSSFKRQLENLATGTTVSIVNKGNFETIEIHLPPLPIQQAIVAKLEALFSELDKGIEQLKTAQQQLRTYRQAVLKAAFEGRLTGESLNHDLNDDMNTMMTKNHSPSNNQTNHSADGLPEGWKWVGLSDISEVSGGITKNAKRDQLPLKIPFLRVANVYFNELLLDEMHTIGVKEAELDRALLKKGDLLFVEGNGSLDQIGRVAVWNGSIHNCVHQNHLIKARFKKNICTPILALYYFCSKAGRDNIKLQASSTSGLHTLSISKVAALKLPLPPFEKQEAIVSEIESRLSVADKLAESIAQGLQQAEALRQSILKKAFEGELVI